jgi:hypothetical protein
MVWAILKRGKTMTRRLPGLARINERPDDWSRAIQLSDGTWSFWYPGTRNGLQEFALRAYPNGGGFKCPYGVYGDRLWVRESLVLHTGHKARYKADGAWVDLPPDYKYPKWWPSRDSVPSIFMPKNLSRLWLQVITVRAERLQRITEQDAKAEGVRREFEVSTEDFIYNKDWNANKASTYRLGFKHLWDSLNEKRGYGWDKNPWVWVVEFERTT